MKLKKKRWFYTHYDLCLLLLVFIYRFSFLQANGIITGFTIQWGPKPENGKPFIPEESRHFDAGESQGTITDLEPGQRYTFQIQARTKVEEPGDNVLLRYITLRYRFVMSHVPAGAPRAATEKNKCTYCTF